LAVNMMIGTLEMARNRRNTSWPSIPGNMRSSTTRSASEPSASLLAVSSNHRKESIRPEIASHHIANRRLIVDDQHLFHHVPLHVHSAAQRRMATVCSL
jgi:hypothetical protein